MKNFKKLVLVFTVVAALGAGGTAYAATTNQTPAEVAAGLTGKSVETLNQERATGKTYGAIAKEAGRLEEFKSKMLEQKKDVLDQRVADGTLTQEKADTIYNSIKENQANCNGTGNANMDRKHAGFGLSKGNGLGNGQGAGTGAGNGAGAGNGPGIGFGARQGLTQ